MPDGGKILLSAFRMDHERHGMDLLKLKWEGVNTENMVGRVQNLLVLHRTWKINIILTMGDCNPS